MIDMPNGPDRFTEIASKSYFKRFIESLNGLFLGPLLVIGSVWLLYWNEGRVDITQYAREALEFSAQGPAKDIPNGTFVAAHGMVHTDDMLTDNEFIVPGNYLVFTRSTQVYAWVEHQHTVEQPQMGGSQTTTTTYSYDKGWVDAAAESSSFRHPEGHANKEKTIHSMRQVASKAAVGNYLFDAASIDWPIITPLWGVKDANISVETEARLKRWFGVQNRSDYDLRLSVAMLKKNIPAMLVAGDAYTLFVSRDGKSTYQEPRIGDMRIKYQVISSGFKGTVFGTLKEAEITPYIVPDKAAHNVRIYRVFFGTKFDALSELRHEYTTGLWLLRIVGLLLMWGGFVAFLAPLSVLFGVIPFLEAAAQALVSFISLMVALPLGTVIILVSRVAHSPKILMGIAVGVLALLAILAWRWGWKKRTKNTKINQ